MRALNLCGSGALLAGLIASSLIAAEPAIPPSTAAGEVDPVTRRRAEEALQALATPSETMPAVTVDPALLARIQEVEAWLRECAILVEAGEQSAAGERFLKAATAVKAFSEDERRNLGKRYRAAVDRLGGFARGFAEAPPPAQVPNQP